MGGGLIIALHKTLPAGNPALFFLKLSKEIY